MKNRKLEPDQVLFWQAAFLMVMFFMPPEMAAEIADKATKLLAERTEFQDDSVPEEIT